MVLLHMKTDNALNTTLAKFDSIYDNAFIQFSNINNNIYLSGIANNTFKIYNPSIINDDGLIYNNNQLSVKSHNTQIIKYNNFTVFPNDFTPLNSYQFTELNAGNLLGFANCFDLNSTTFWQSEAIYSRNEAGIISITNINVNDPYNFQNTNSRGYWVKIKFPYQIIPIGIYFSSLTTLNSPVFFDIFVSNDNINWIKILVVNTTTLGNEFFFRENTTLYLYLAIVITKIIPDTSDSANVIQSFRINDIRIYSMPILHIDNNVKIANNNLFNLNTISANRLVLNNTTITSVNDLGSYVTTQAVQTMVDLYNIYWKNTGTTGFLNSNIVNRISINSNIANSTLDVNGDIAFKQRSLNNSFAITNKGGVFDISSSNVYIGKLNCSNNTTNYFKLSFILFEYDKYYFQTIDINGYSIFNSNLNIYWNTTFDSTYLKQRVVDVKYQIQSEINNITSILFYFKYNPDLNITTAIAFNDLNSDYINNIIYSDIISTSHLSNIDFSIRGNTNQMQNLDNDIYSNTYLINATSLTQNSNTIITINTSNLTASNIKTTYLNSSNINVTNIQLSNNLIINSNFLMLDAKKEIVDSGISSNTLSRFINLPSLSNKILGTNNNGSIIYLEQSSLLLSNISYQTNENNKILISSNNLFEGFTINKNNLSNLNKITDTPDAFVIIDENNNLKTTSSVPLSNIANILGLFKYNQIADNGLRGVICNSNIITSNIRINSNLSVNNNFYLGNSYVISSNNKFNNILINNREIADNIFKYVIKLPDYNDVISEKIERAVISSMSETEPIDFEIKFSNFSIIVSIDKDDNLFDNNKKIYNIFDKSLNNYWESELNFGDYNNFDFNTKYGAVKRLPFDLINATLCGSYIIFTLPTDFIINFYIIYVNYLSLINSIRDFKLFGFDYSNNTWILLDERNNIIMNNNLIPNVFTIDKNNFKIFSKYAFCFINTHNTINDNPSSIIINGFEFYGYPLNPYYLTSNNIITYNNENKQVFLGTANIGINNFNPYCPLSIGNDLPSNPRNSMININHPSFVNNQEMPIMTLTRSSLNPTYGGIKTTHYLNSWYDSNTNYTIKLSHTNINNEKVILSMNSSGNVAIGGYPPLNLNNNGLSIYDNNNKFVNISVSSLNSNYSIILPSNMGSNSMALYIDSIVESNVKLKFNNPIDEIISYPIVNFNSIGFTKNNSNIIISPSLNTSNYSIHLPSSYGSNNMTFIIDKVENESNLYFKFANPVSNLISTSYIKIGNNEIKTRNESNITVQIAGKCLIGYNSNDVSNISSNYFSNALTVVGKMYVTNDSTNDSDISYKYDIKLIEDPLAKINKINGYTFNRNDTDDDRRYSGLIAQEVIKVMPEVVTVKHDGKYRIIYTTLAGLFVEAIKTIDKKYDYINLKLNCFIGIIGIGCLFLFMKK